MLTRYATYALSFIVTMYIASKMGPYYYGMWGYLLLILNYFNVINLGIPQALQVLLIQKKESYIDSCNYEKSGIYLTGILSLGCVLTAIYYYCGGLETAHRYDLDFLFYIICFCGVLNYFNLLYGKIYRTRNYVFELAFQQTSVVLFMFVAMFLAKDKYLLYSLVGCYLISYFLTFLLYSFKGGINYNGNFIGKYAKNIINKGLYLFLYNSGFYLIVISTKTMISVEFSIEQFGLFSFAYLLGHAVYQLLEAFSFLITTKLLDKYNSKDVAVILSTIKLIRINFVALFHGIMYLAMIFFPFLLYLLPKYESTLQLIYLCCMTMLLYTNSFGYSTFLMARNKEKILAFIAVSSLVLNIILGLILIKVFNIGYEYVILATMFTYLYYAILCVYFGRRELNITSNYFDILIDCFPFKLLLPFLSAILIIILNIKFLIVIPLILYLSLNINTIKDIIKSFKKILFNPNIIDV